MELTVRNLVKSSSCHFTCGRFSELFSEIGENLGRKTVRISAPWGESPYFDPAAVPADCELITITANETSTGTMCLNQDIGRIRRGCPDQLLSVDITSLAGMKALNIADADVWLFSVQKGFGLPGGLGIMIVSPQAFAKSLELSQKKQNIAGSFTFSAMDRLIARGGQTVCTPNVLGIFLLSRKLARWNASGGLRQKELETVKKASLLYKKIDSHPRLKCFVKDPPARSISVACIEGLTQDIAKLHEAAAKENILLGKGYGKLKETTFRLALFPAITDEDLNRVLRLIGEI
jgi:phosphoserine aminotransferase